MSDSRPDFFENFFLRNLLDEEKFEPQAFVLYIPYIYTHIYIYLYIDGLNLRSVLSCERIESPSNSQTNVILAHWACGACTHIM